MQLPRPPFVNLSIEPNYVTCFLFNEEVTQSTFSATVRRSDFEQAFPSIDLSTAFQLSYEPQRNHVSVIRERAQTEFYSNPETYPPEINKIIALSRDIYEWFYDQKQLQSPPSKYHTYSTSTHEWSITPEDEKKLAEDNIAREVSNELNAFAKTRGYDNINSACSYATSSDPVFKAEADYCVWLRDDWWITFRSIFAEVTAGTRPTPQTFADIRAEFPNPSWPE